MAANIKVVVRVRPLNEREKAANSRVVVDVVDDTMLVFDPIEKKRPFFYQGVKQPMNKVLCRANKDMKFVFDNVCGQTATNKDIFEMTTKDVLASLMEGYNCSVFVYGATGAGKTFTMIGTKENPGITYLTMDHLFYTINLYEREREFDIGVSYIEVYNENVFDLLKPSRTPLQVREDTNVGVMVAGLTLANINTARQLLDMLENGNKNRTQHPTDANAESSRSHAVFQVFIKMLYKTSGESRVVKLSMIDLAGSERASASGCVGVRFKEGANINRSLLSLGNCINNLAEGGSYIPYRDSKLTRLLKDTLGGNCKTVMIANISPLSATYEDTYNTLKYASRANTIQLSVTKNAVDGDMKLSEYVKTVEELKNKVKELETKLSLSSLAPAPAKEQPNLAKEKAKADWRRRILQAEKLHVPAEEHLLGLRTRGKVLALRRRLRARAFTHVADLAHRSSNEAMELMVTEDIPRQERAAESYMKRTEHLDSKIQLAQAKCGESWQRLQNTLEQAVTECPDLRDFSDIIIMQKQLRLSKASDNLRMKLLWILNKEINSSTEYMNDMPGMLRKLYLTLKGYDKVPTALATEYIDLMKKAKCMKSISWDTGNECDDPQFKLVSSLLDETQILSDLTDIENREVLPKKRKGTPIKLANNKTIFINDAFENSDATRILNSAKKVKLEVDAGSDIENTGVKDLNSTLVLAEKMEALKKPKVEFNLKNEVNTEAVYTKRGLTDRTNLPRTINFNDKAKMVKPMVDKAIPVRRAAPARPAALAPARPAALAPARHAALAPARPAALAPARHAALAPARPAALAPARHAALAPARHAAPAPARPAAPAPARAAAPAPARLAAPAPARLAAPAPRAPGFGFSLAGTSQTRHAPQAGKVSEMVGYKAVRARERVAAPHPYSRPVRTVCPLRAYNQKKIAYRPHQERRTGFTESASCM